MGIRFHCPNGHRLHVKAYLAGRRGVCPDCGSKVLIPRPAARSASDQLVAVRTTAAEPQSNPAAGMATADAPGLEKSPAKSNSVGGKGSIPVATSVHEPTANAEPLPMWFVRPSSGGQFGPVANEAMSRWIREGRVVADAYVWREGWADWRVAGDVAEELPYPLAPPTSAPISSDAQTVQLAASDASPAIRRQNSRQRDHRRRLISVGLLLMLIVVLAGILVWVLGSG